MALMTYPDCGKQCSTAAASCPNCGRPIGENDVINNASWCFYKFVIEIKSFTLNARPHRNISLLSSVKQKFQNSFYFDNIFKDTYIDNKL